MLKDDFIAMSFPAKHTILDSKAEECGFKKPGFLKADVHQASPNTLSFATLPLLVLILRGHWMLESKLADKGSEVCNYFQGNAQQHMTISFAKWFLLFQRSYNRKNNQNPQRHCPNKYSNQKDKIDRSCPRFCHKIKFYYVRKAHSLLSLPLSVSPWQTHI